MKIRVLSAIAMIAIAAPLLIIKAMPAPKHHRSNILDNFLFCVKTAKGKNSTPLSVYHTVAV